jgi:hypothetical protein
LGLVAHLDQEEGDGGGKKGAQLADRLGALVFLVGNTTARIQRIACGPSQIAAAAPALAASAWLASVAARMPRIMGTGWR